MNKKQPGRERLPKAQHRVEVFGRWGRRVRYAPRLSARPRRIDAPRTAALVRHPESTRVERPDVSVIVPVHDMPMKLVRRAIRSVRRQCHAGTVETVLWDDGSRAHDYRDVAASFATARAPAGPRPIVHRRTEQRRGIANARNDAVSVAGAEWLLWLDGDDELPDSAIAALLASVRESGNPFVVGQCRVRYPGGARQVHRNSLYLRAWQAHAPDDPLARVVFNVHGGLVRRDLFDSTGGFDPWFTHAELVDWFRRVLAALPDRRTLDVLDTVTYVHHKRAGSHSADRARVHTQRLTALHRYAEGIGLAPAELDAPQVNAATGCPEYKRVELAKVHPSDSSP